MNLLLAQAAWIDNAQRIDACAQLAIERFKDLYIGEKLALATLLAVTLVGSAAAMNRFLAGHFTLPKPRKSVRTPRRKKGSGLKYLVLVLLALLPGGLVGTVSLMAVMGKERWRGDALKIFGGSMILVTVMLAMRLESFPWPHLRDDVFISGALGLVFGILQIWATVKLLREWWGEPDECVAWWPPAALNCQILLLLATLYRLVH